MKLQAVNTNAISTQRSQGAKQPGESQPQSPQDVLVKSESGGHKAARVITNTLVAAGWGAAAGYAGQHAQYGGVAAGAVGGALLGTKYGASAGLQVGKSLGLHIAGSNGEPVAKGIGSLLVMFSGPFVGGGAGLVAGAVAGAAGGPVVSGALMGGLAFVRELAR